MRRSITLLVRSALPRAASAGSARAAAGTALPRTPLHLAASDTSAYSSYNRRITFFTASGGAGAGGEAGGGGGGANGAPPDADTPPSGGAPAELKAEPLQDLLQRLCIADEAAAGEAAEALVRLGAADDGRCAAITAAADTSQLLRLLRIAVEAEKNYRRDGEYEYAGDFFQEHTAMARALLRSLAARARGDRAVCEAVSINHNMIPILIDKLDCISGDDAAEALAALAKFGGERCRAALFSAGLLPRLLHALSKMGSDDIDNRTKDADCASYVLGALVAAGSDAERDALLAAGAVPLLVEQLSGRYGERPRVAAASIVLESVSALQHLATTTERARGRIAEVRAAGGVAALIELLDETLCRSSWWLEYNTRLASAAEAALLAMGEEHRRASGGAARPFLSTKDAEALLGIAACERGCKFRFLEGEEYKECDEECCVDMRCDCEDNGQRAAVAMRLLARLA